MPSKHFLDTYTLIDFATNERELHKEAVDMVSLGAKGVTRGHPRVYGEHKLAQRSDVYLLAVLHAPVQVREDLEGHNLEIIRCHASSFARPNGLGCSRWSERRYSNPHGLSPTCS